MKIYNSLLRLSIATLALTSLFAFSSCSDDDEPAFIPSLPANGRSNVTSITRTGDIYNTSYDWNFTYAGPRLVKATGVIRDPNSDIDCKHKYTSQLGYGNRRIVLQNSTREDVKITLNGSNLIDRMIVDKNVYEFQYENGHLSAWQKTVFEPSFGQSDRYKSSAVLIYENDDLKRIEYTGPDNVVVTTTFTRDERNNLNGILPETVASEMGCLGFEHLYYAGLLGKPTAHLIKSISVHHPKEQDKCYTIDFDYSVRGDNTLLCSYSTPAGGIVATVYKY